MSGDSFNVEQAMAVGPKAVAKAKRVQFIKIQGIEAPLDAQRLADELKTLRAAIRDREDVDPDERDGTLGALLEAQKATEEGDADRAKTALARVGKWVLKVAEGIGVGVAVAALRQSLIGA
jgi:hypothetical protein